MLYGEVLVMVMVVVMVMVLLLVLVMGNSKAAIGDGHNLEWSRLLGETNPPEAGRDLTSTDRGSPTYLTSPSAYPVARPHDRLVQ